MHEFMKSVFQPAHDIVVRKVVGETIIVPISGDLADMQRIFSLNPVAEYIWERLDGHTSVSDICSGVLEQFEVEPGQAEKDLLDFIRELQAARLII